jgi:hypothetical protein
MAEADGDGGDLGHGGEEPVLLGDDGEAGGEAEHGHREDCGGVDRAGCGEDRRDGGDAACAADRGGPGAVAADEAGNQDGAGDLPGAVAEQGDHDPRP